MNGWSVGWLDGWMDGWMNGWMDGWLVGWMDGWRGAPPPPWRPAVPLGVPAGGRLRSARQPARQPASRPATPDTDDQKGGLPGRAGPLLLRNPSPARPGSDQTMTATAAPRRVVSFYARPAATGGRRAAPRPTDRPTGHATPAHASASQREPRLGGPASSSSSQVPSRSRSVQSYPVGQPEPHQPTVVPSRMAGRPTSRRRGVHACLRRARATALLLVRSPPARVMRGVPRRARAAALMMMMVMMKLRMRTVLPRAGTAWGPQSRGSTWRGGRGCGARLRATPARLPHVARGWLYVGRGAFGRRAAATCRGQSPGGMRSLRRQRRCCAAARTTATVQENARGQSYGNGRRGSTRHSRRSWRWTTRAPATVVRAAWRSSTTATQTMRGPGTVRLEAEPFFDLRGLLVQSCSCPLL
eukprot:scaffold111_cov404-Prasinococcus_capsulatus_cf.AAC.18